MFPELVSRNDDIRRLVDKGYAVAFVDNYLVVRDVPYLDSTGALKVGAIVTKLKDVGGSKFAQEDHQIFFAGSPPYSLAGAPIPNLADRPTTLPLSDESIQVQRQFSNKPKPPAVDFADFFEKIESYVTIISGPAMEKYDHAKVLTFRVDQNVVKDSIFKVNDTLTSRAEIGDLAQKLREDRVVVIGLGGTGSYLLDFLVKSPVKEIRGFDKDPFHVHNAFRSPGRFVESEFDKPKAEVYSSRYENFRHGLKLEAKRIDATSTAEVDGATFAFVCVDKGSSRAGILDLLIAKKIPFIDVGMGLHRQVGLLNGKVRLTYFPPQRAPEIRALKLVEEADAPADEYRTQVQTAELNALNAALAIVRYKQLRGFYFENRGPLHVLLDLEDMKVFGDRFDP